MMSLMQTAMYKMAAPTVVFLWLLNFDFEQTSKTKERKKERKKERTTTANKQNNNVKSMEQLLCVYFLSHFSGASSVRFPFKL